MKKRLAFAAILWSVGVLFSAYSYRVLFVDPEYSSATEALVPAAVAAVTTILQSK